MSENIHFTHLSSGPGGLELLLPVVIKNMPDRSFSAFVIRSRHMKHSVYEDMPVTIKYGSNRNIPAYFKTLMYAIKNRRSVFHVFNIGPVFLLLIKLAGAKNIIYSIHGTIYWKNRFGKWIFRFLWQIALLGKTTLVANSQYSRNEFLKKINSRVNIRVLYNPIDLNRFSPGKTFKSNREILVIYSGRLEKGKNLPLWIETAAYLHEKIPGTRFEIYGEGSLKPLLQQQIAELKAGDYIQMKGFRKDIEDVYRRSDAFLFLSEYESFGNVVIESVLCGTPVITSPLPVMKEIFDGYPQFVLREGKDLKEQVLLKLLQLDQLEKLTNCVRESFIKRFSVEGHIKSLRKIYSECE